MSVALAVDLIQIHITVIPPVVLNYTWNVLIKSCIKCHSFVAKPRFCKNLTSLYIWIISKMLNIKAVWAVIDSSIWEINTYKVKFDFQGSIF